MKKQYISVILICLAAIVSLQFLSCSNILSPSRLNDGGNGSKSGNVIVSFSTGAGRAALSPITMNFDSYRFSFYKPDPSFGEILEFYENRDNNGSNEYLFNLEEGVKYAKLVIDAYSGGKLAATGESKQFTVEKNGSTLVPVHLKGALTGGGKGTFTWNISYPKGTKIDDLQLYANDSEYVLLTDDYAEEIVPSNPTVTVIGELQNIDAGVYLFIARLSRLNGDAAGYANAVEIFPGQVTNFTWDFTDYIKDPNVENEGIPVETWHGFNIKGNGVETIPGYPVATLYNTYRDKEGLHKDVLKLEPPAGGYDEGSVILTFKLPKTGYYTLSMDVFIEKDNYRDVLISYELTHPRWEPDPLTPRWGPVLVEDEDPLFGEWFTVETEVDPGSLGNYMLEDYVLGLLGKGWEPDNPGLNDYTVYLKNPMLYVRNRGPAPDFNTITDQLIGVPGASGSLKIMPEVLNLYPRVSEQLVLTGDISEGHPVWSSNNAFVTVDQKGIVTAGINAGAAVITVKSGTKEAKATVNVSLPDKYIALTFDDGPDPAVTGTLLDELEEADVHATFFLLGMRADYNETHRNLVQRMHTSGHDIGSHSWAHFSDIYDWESTSVNTFKDNLLKTQRVIADVTGGKAPRFFRPPNLFESVNLLTAAKELGLPCIGGEMLDDWDYGVTPQTIIDTAMRWAKPWGILVFHDYVGGESGYTDHDNNGVNTVAAIPEVIRRLRAEGYGIVSLSEMLTIKKASLEPGEMYYSIAAVPSGTEAAVKVDSLEVPTTITLGAGTSQQITATVGPSGATNKNVYWYSADENVAKVSSYSTLSGAPVTVTAAGVGTTTIYALAEGKLIEVKATVSN